MDKAAVERWVAGYERAWRTPGAEQLAELFSPDVSYLPSPWSRPIVGLPGSGSGGTPSGTAPTSRSR